MEYSDIVFNDRFGTSPVYSGSLLVEVAEYVSTRGYSAPLWADNFKGRSRLCTEKPINCFARIHVQETPEPTISEEQIQEMNFTNERLIVVAWPSGKALLYYPISYKDNMPYEGRQYRLNVSDCYRLAMDFYKREFNIELNVYRADTSYLRFAVEAYTYNTMLMQYAKNGFEAVAVPQYGDGILISSVPNAKLPEHVAIYLGDGNILHHYADKLSCIQPYSSYWKDRTIMIVRHKERL